jgi:hypothetical protein
MFEQSQSQGANFDASTVVSGEDVVKKFSQASAPKRQRAKDLAASMGYQWLRVQFPNIDLTNV